MIRRFVNGIITGAGIGVGLALLIGLVSVASATGSDTEFIFANQLAPNRFTQTNEFAGGINVSGGVMTLKVATDCSIESCDATGQACVTGSNLFLCDTSALLYRSVTTGTQETPTNSPSALNLQPQSCVPTICSIGKVMMMTNGAECHCYATDSWENTGGTGVCEICTAGSGNPGHQL